MGGAVGKGAKECGEDRGEGHAGQSPVGMVASLDTPFFRDETAKEWGTHRFYFPG